DHTSNGIYYFYILALQWLYKYSTLAPILILNTDYDNNNNNNQVLEIIDDISKTPLISRIIDNTIAEYIHEWHEYDTSRLTRFFTNINTSQIKTSTAHQQANKHIDIQY